MVDVTFFLVVLFGGALVGLVTAVVRRHDRKRKVLDVIAGAVGGFAGTPLWLAFVRFTLPHMTQPPAEMRRSFALVLSDLYYFSPIIGAFLAVGLLSLVYRYGFGQRREEPWLALLGDALQIVGIVYLAIAICLTAALVALAAYQSRWELVSPGALFIDVVYGGTLAATGWAMARLSRRSA
ncbi:MAG TPA: hypothetical protein VEA77_02200 [Hyphomicrobium sp.]|nr:hypothetical protein [Hyphomicrobium sp.]